MKRNHLVLSAVLSCVLTAGCKPEQNPAGELKIVSLAITSGENAGVPGEITYDIKVSDVKDLSTLEISAALEDGTVIASESVRTPGKECSLEGQTFALPFAAGMAEGAAVGISFEAVNVDGNSVKQVRTVSVVRPALPDVLYMTTGDTVYEMKRDLENPDLYTTAQGFYDSVVSAHISTSESLADSEFVWGASETGNTGAIADLSSEGIAVSYPTVLVSSWSFDAVGFKVIANGEELDIAVNNVKLAPAGGVLYASVNFTEGKEVTVSGIGDIESAYNRDFFSYEGGRLVFLRASGSYDVYYSPKYNYLWIAKDEAVAPECYWIVGTGFTEVPRWHDDWNHSGWWGMSNTIELGYLVKISDTRYQCSLYLNNSHEWGLEFETYSDRVNDDNPDGKEEGFCISGLKGDSKGLAVTSAKSGCNGIKADTDFAKGYYTLIYDVTDHSVTLVRHTPWPEVPARNLSVGGVEMEDHVEYSIINSIHLTKGQQVAYSGFADMGGACNRDFFSYEGGRLTFLRESGNYTLSYYPAYNYIYVYQTGASCPDCLYLWGNGRVALPAWNEDLGYNANNGYNSFAPYYSVAPKIAEHKYQTTMSVCTYNDWWDVRIVVFKDADGAQEVMPVNRGDILSGNYGEGEGAAGFHIINPGVVSGNWGAAIYIDDDAGNTKGTYTFTITLDNTDSEIAGIEINRY